MDRRTFLKTLGLGAAGAALGELVLSYEYADLPLDIPVIESDYQVGRTKNSIAAVVAGLVAQNLYSNSRIDVEIQKHVWLDARVTGQTTPTSVNTHVDLFATSVHYQAQANSDGLLEGTVDKSELNWTVKQTSDNSYEIARFGPKFDSTLELTVEDKRIEGTYIRGGPHFNWTIDGTYDAQGNVKIDIDGHLNLGIRLVGRISEE